MKKYLATLFILFFLSGVSHAQAAIIHFVGGESGGIEELESNGTMSVSSLIKRSGNYSFRTNPTGSGTGFIGIRPPDATGSLTSSSGSNYFVDDIYINFWVRVDTFPSTGAEGFVQAQNTSNATLFTVRLNYDGTLTMADGIGSLRGTTTAALAPNTWHYINIKVNDGASGPYEIRIDNTSALSGTGNFGTAYRKISIGKTSNIAGNSVDVYIDDVVIDGASFGTDGQRVIGILPNANGTYSDWSNDDYTIVDETPHDNTTTNATSVSDGGKVSWNLTNTSSANISGTIHAVKGLIIARESSNVTAAFQLLFKSGTAEATTTSIDLFAGMGGVTKILFTDPNTGSAWTTGGVDGLELGGIAVSQGGTFFQLTQATAQVLFTPPDITPPVISNVATSSVLATSAIISWNTNESATSSVSYGTTLSYGSASSSSATTTAHSITLTGLSSGTTYNFRVSSQDEAGNVGTSTNYTLTTVFVDNTPPVISSVASSTAASTSTISWTTDEAATSAVYYGTSTGVYFASSSASSLVTTHSRSLSSLTPSTQYYFVVVSRDAQSNIATSSEYTFATRAYNLVDDLIVQYTFDSVSITDVTGNGNNGSLTGSTTLVSGVVGNALLFGTSSYATIPVSASTPLDLMSDFTVSFWIKSESNTSNANWVGRDYPIWKLGTDSNATMLNFNVGASSLATAVFPVNKFMLITGTYSTSTKLATLYKDGVFLATSTLGNFSSNSLPIYINDNADHSTFAIDDLRIYSRMLSRSEVASLHDFGISGGTGQNYNLNVVKTGTGTGTVTAGGISCGSDCFRYASSSLNLTFTAVPSAGSTFTGWSGGGCSGTGTCSLTVTDHTIIVATFSAGAASGGGTTYVVKADGSEDFTTVQACANAAVPGDTCEVTAGTYAETLTPTVSGTYSQPIKIKAATGATVNLNTVNFDSVDFVYLEGIKVQNISQWGIGYGFNTYYEVGLFANEDYWVKGPVTISSLTPNVSYTASTTLNGWEVNPVYDGPQGFDSRSGNFSATLIPTLPYTSGVWESIVKTKSRVPSYSICEPVNRPCLQSASVLTVVPETLPDYGQKVFRPSYVSKQKPLFPAFELKTDLLPSYPLIARATTTASISTLKPWIERVQLDHKPSSTGRSIHPSENMGDYGGDIAITYNDIALRLMLADSVNTKMPLLLPYVQAGIDAYFTYLSGQEWFEQGGHTPGRRVLFAFTGSMLDSSRIKNTANSVTFFNEDVNYTYRPESGRALFGVMSNFDSYWAVVGNAGASGERNIADPYGYVDGGPFPGSFYQPTLAGPHRASALAAILMPALRDAWNTTELDELVDYSDRITVFGLWALPDPCAATSTGGGANGSDCVLHSNLTATSTMDDFTCQTGLLCLGRFQSLGSHGKAIDGFGYQSFFQEDMWNAYRATSTYGLPSISAIASSTTDTSVVITWTTNEKADSLIEYGITSSLIASSTFDARLVTSHSATLNDLKACTKYFFKIKSLDASRNPVQSSTGTFRTTGCTGGASIVSDTQNTITSVGGSVSLLSSGKGLALTVPASFASTTNTAYFQIKQLDKTSFINSAGTPSGKTAVGSYVYNLKSLAGATTTLASFDNPLTVTISYDDSDVSSFTESTLRIYRYDGVDWNELSGCSVDEALNTVTCSTSRFSDFVLVGQSSGSSSNSSNNSSQTTSSSSSGKSSVRRTVQYSPIVTSIKTQKDFIAFLVSVGIISQESSQKAEALIKSFSNTFTRNLSVGVTGDDVKELQKYLNSKGFLVSKQGTGSLGKETNLFGPSTKQALARFQSYYGLPATGYFGPLTRELIRSQQ